MVFFVANDPTPLCIVAYELKHLKKRSKSNIRARTPNFTHKLQQTMITIILKILKATFTTDIVATMTFYKKK